MTENNKLTKCSTCEKEIAKDAKTCPHCGAKNKTDNKYSPARIAIGAAIGILFLSLIASIPIEPERDFQGFFPPCDSKYGIEQAILTYDNSPHAKVSGLKIHAIKNPQEEYFMPDIGKRLCKGVAFMNNGKRPIEYSFEDAGGELWIQVKPLPTKQEILQEMFR